MLTINVRNVNEALPVGTMYLREQGVEISPRGIKTLEYPEPVCTTYREPIERVLFEPLRDANPFFHLMESLWILSGRQDVEFVSKFNSNIKNFSDDGKVFNGAYGFRLRRFFGQDQLRSVVNVLRKDPDSRKAVLAIWSPVRDLDTETKDTPCNDLIMFKIRKNKLNMTVCNRSNDMIWGAYGANVVHFSFIQEYVAAMLGIKMGVYNQISDSFHIYPDNPLWDSIKRLSLVANDYYQYEFDGVRPVISLVTNTETFDNELFKWINDPDWYGETGETFDNRFFPGVVIPMWNAWFAHKNNKDGLKYVEDIRAFDWKIACKQWLQRRESD